MDAKTRILLKFLIGQSKEDKFINIGAYLSSKLYPNSRKTKKYVDKLIKLFSVSGANAIKDKFICEFYDEKGLEILEKSLQKLRNLKLICCYDDEKFCYENDGTDIPIIHKKSRYISEISVIPWDRHPPHFAFAVGNGTVVSKKDKKLYNWDFVCEITDVGKKYPVTLLQRLTHWIKFLYNKEPVSFIAYVFFGALFLIGIAWAACQYLISMF